MMTDNYLFRVTYVNKGETSPSILYARYLSEESVIGFIELDGLIFPRHNTLLNPSIEQQRTAFSGVSRTYIPINSICRIDEVSKQHVLDMWPDTDDNVRQFPNQSPIIPPSSDD